MKVVSFRFERSVHRPEEVPRAPGPDVVFFGRSNVGKSSLINRMLGAKGLAKTSSTPGRTQSANFYRINDAVWFVDLPGYGFARAPAAVREAWRPLVEGVLRRRRERFALGVLVVDARHGFTELDVTMGQWLEDRALPFLVAGTKVDKLSGNERQTVRRSMKAAIGKAEGALGPVLVSARTGAGIREIWGHVDAALAATT